MHAHSDHNPAAFEVTFMRVLLIYPRFPKTFWSYERVLALVGRKALTPPLSLVTVAALLPQDWEFRLIDRNVGPATEADWQWAELVMLSAMIVQCKDFLDQIREAKMRGKTVVVGGPYPTAVPDDADAAGADYLVLAEGENTIPLFLEALADGAHTGRAPKEKAIRLQADGPRPDITRSPIPRFDLLEFDAYDTMSVQFSRGCPFNCEFCDIIVLYGRTPRTKTPPQMLGELERLLQLGWRRGVFLVDDNFIGNRRNAKRFLRALRPWLARHRYPFPLNTEASIDLAEDPELLDLMAECHFDTVFIGIETPDQASLSRVGKHQNNRRPMAESVEAIARAGMRVQAGFIIGFDDEAPAAGERIVTFIEETAIPTVMFSMLQALPHTALWHRLRKERRLLTEVVGMNQTGLINFVPTRPLEDIGKEYVAAFWQLYDPVRYLDRTYRYFRRLAPPRRRERTNTPGSFDLRKMIPLLRDKVMFLRAFFIICWRQGVRRRTHWKFWHHFVSIALRNPRVWIHYLAVCAHNEHYLAYRQIVRDQIESQIAAGLISKED